VRRLEQFDNNNNHFDKIFVVNRVWIFLSFIYFSFELFFSSFGFDLSRWNQGKEKKKERVKKFF